MNFNQFSTYGLKLIDDPYNSRAKLDTGTHCNYACGFCYYLDQLDVVTPLDKIKERARKIRDFGITEIDLSGGESSIHKNWFDILDYCKEIGFTNISCLSNGHRFAKKEFVEKSKKHGLTEILFSLHGWDEESHAQIVNRKNSFHKMLRAIDNCKELGVKVRINCTITSLNAPHLQEYVELINKINPFQINFLPLNYWEDAENVDGEDYVFLSEHIKKAIDLLNKKIEINVRYIPYCFMQGYEKYVVGTYQHIFDKGDWNLITYEVDKFEVKDVTIKDYFKSAEEKRNFTYHKNEKCFKCKYFLICDGVESKIKDYQDVFPIEGEKIDDVQFYRRGHYPICNYKEVNDSTNPVYSRPQQG